MPRVSVVITAFDSAAFLGEAVQSVLAQPVDLECIVVDDASTDETAAVLDGFGDVRLKVLRNDENTGPFASANRGLELASGEFIARLDADDACLPGRLERQLAFLDANPSIGLLGSSCWRVDEAGRPLAVQAVPASDLAIRLRCLVAPPFVHSTVTWRRRLGLRYDASLRVAGDYELWTRALDLTRAANLEEPLVRYRVWPGGLSSRQRKEQRAMHVRIATAWSRRQWPSLDLDESAFAALRTWCDAGAAPPLPAVAQRLVVALQQAVLGTRPSPDALENFARALFTPSGSWGQPTPPA